MTRKKHTGTDWKTLKRKDDSKIDFSEIPELGAEFWHEANIIIPGGKSKVTIRIDTDVYRWFMAQGPKFQTRINAVLRSYMDARKKRVKTNRKLAM